MTEYRVGAIMRREIPMVGPEMPIRRAVALLVDNRAAAAPVVGDDGRLVGILTQKDCFQPVLHASYHREWTGTVEDQMSRDVVAVDIDDEVIQAAEMFLAHPHRVFPVLDGGTVVGILRRSDVLAFLASLG